MRNLGIVSAAAAALCLSLAGTAASGQTLTVMYPQASAVTPPLSQLPDGPKPKGNTEHAHHPVPSHAGRGGGGPDTALQTSLGPLINATGGASFDGVGANGYAPPDSNMAVGPNHIFAAVNSQYAIYNKTGALVLGPKTLSSLWTGVSGGCATQNAGDVVVQYDKLADRWILTQLSSLSSPYGECIAVSTGSDPTGSYKAYYYNFGTNLPDYPKFGVWPTATNSAYLATYNLFANGASFAGADLCAYDRAAMIAGAASPVSVCYTINDASYLPSDLDGSTPPPAGTPGYFVTYETLSSLRSYKLAPNFANTSLSTLTLVSPDLGVTPFSELCGGGTCIPQAGTTNRLDSLADRPMYRLAYRNFGGSQSMVFNHSVAAGTSGGVRWYELRSTGGAFGVNQQGTYAPDTAYRWMGSAAMDQNGDIAIGFSVSSSTTRPGVHYTGRVPSDPAGTMETEGIIIDGAGSQTNGLHRWGDYSALRIDPNDDCTFWYINEYLNSDGAFNWRTRIGSFKFTACGAAPVLTSITVSPSSTSVPTGGTKQFSATALDQFGNAMNPQPAFAWSVSGGGTIDPSSGLFTAGGSAGGPFTVTAGSGGKSGTASVTVTSVPVLTTISVSPPNASVQTGKTQQFTATGLDQNGNPMNPQPTFAWSVSGGGTIDPSSGLFTAGGTAGGPFTVTATAGGKSGTANVTVTALPDFALSVSPASRSVKWGTVASYTVTITPTNGFSGPVTLSVTGQPSGFTATFTPNPATTSSTLNVQTVTGVRGNFTLTIQGVSGGLTHTTTAGLSVKNH